MYSERLTTISVHVVLISNNDSPLALKLKKNLKTFKFLLNEDYC